jgi:glycosyltransferase involved in cell wall biosynthesis
MTGQAAAPSLSVIVPVGVRRAADMGALYREYRANIAATGAKYEFIFVLDGPRPEARRALETLLREGEDFTIVNLTRNFGEAAALTAGFERASGGTIVTLPAYPQVDPADLRKLLAGLSTADMSIGYRWPRHGNALDRVRRSAFHGLVNWVTGARLRDLGCGARAMRRQVLEEIDLYGDQHRFLPILAMRLGFRVSETPIRQSAQDRHARIYRPREYMHHLLDLFSIFFLMRFTKKPLRFFGMLGAATFGIGAVLIAYLGLDRLLLNEPLADRPALLLAALLLVLGMQIFALGLLGELIIFTHARGLKDYRVEEIIQYPEAVAASDSGSDSVPDDPAASPEMRATTPPAVTA